MSQRNCLLDEDAARCATRWLSIPPFDLMKFTLTYSGPLPSSGNKRKLRDVWAIRNALHPQLAELWHTHPVLRGHGFHAVAKVEMPLDFSTGKKPPSWASRREKLPSVEIALRTTPRNKHTLIALARCIEVEGKSFLPIVRKSLSLMCDLDILFLRKEEPGSLILQGGDTDGRLKTLFDALRAPSEGEIKDYEPVARPLHCLMEQDALIASHSVKPDRLLTSLDSDVHQVHLVIGVTIRVMQINWENIGFIGE
jgi:hypothetical protein